MSKTCSTKSYKNQFKVSVVGCGAVGATGAYAMLLDGTPTELVLIDVAKDRVNGLQLDFEHSLSLIDYTKITAGDDVALCKDSQVIFVTAGARQMPGETRLQLIEKNRKIFQGLIPALAKAAPEAILVIVANPVDVLVMEALKLSGFPENRVFGTGTLLDTSRLRFHIAQKLCLSPQSIDAYILGEHGDSSFPVFSSAGVAGKPLNDFDGWSEEIGKECFEETKTAAYRIINDLGFTCYSIAVVMREIMKHIFQNSRMVLPLSVKLNDYYGHSDVALSVPCVLDASGIADVVKVPLNKLEQEQLAESVKILKGYLN